MAKGHVLRALGRPEEAIPEYEILIGSNRNWAAAISHLGWCKLLTGSLEEAIALQQEAIRLSPRDPSVSIWYFRIGYGHLLQSHIDEAIVWFEKARTANPGHPRPHGCLAAAYGLNGWTERAAAELAEVRRSVTAAMHYRPPEGGRTVGVYPECDPCSRRRISPACAKRECPRSSPPSMRPAWRCGPAQEPARQHRRG